MGGKRNRHQERERYRMSKSSLLEDFTDLVTDNLCALVTDPDRLQIGVHETETGLVVDIYAPREQIAMIIGKRGETVSALHRVFLCMARNWSLVTQDGTLNLSWSPA
jgi:predicted RNA-binding protein YlqC (UPF0109 family)